MARRNAIYNTCETIVRLLRSQRVPTDFGGEPLDIEVYGSGNFAHPMRQGVSLFLYRIYLNGGQRSLAGRTVGAERQLASLPIDLHFFLTAWGETASRQHEVAGWMLRVMEDHPILSSSMLNTPAGDVFGTDETLTVMPADLSTEDLFRIWEVLADHRYQLSVPYVARRLDLESDVIVSDRGQVEERAIDVRSVHSTHGIGRAQ